ncbi:MAG: T9SS type A sorting domain-containing protein [Lentimicrobium sp.]|jgi:hypothetical protein|nr:T9SS type A sorting domain-containing protein [Lentimicrobium sp.]
MSKYLRFLFFILFLPLFAIAQHPLLDNFDGFQQDDRIYLRWTFSSGSLCDGTRVFRSGDGEVFQQIGEIAGICGASGRPVIYNYIDSLPVPNALNYYRLELGNNGFTTTVLVDFLVSGEVGYTLFASVSGVELLIADPPAREGVAQVFDLQGRLVNQFVFNTRRIALMDNPWHRGAYIFRLTYDNGSVVSGKFIR